MARDPLAHPEDLIRRVYAYVAYRVGAGSDAEDITSETMLRAVKYRKSYDASRGKPLAWLVGISRTCIAEFYASRPDFAEAVDQADRLDLERDVVNRVSLEHALSLLDPRERELVALRYGADLSTKQIGQLLDLSPNAVDVALHRCRSRLRDLLEDDAPSKRITPLLQAPPAHL